jgi:hypothetical protein
MLSPSKTTRLSRPEKRRIFRKQAQKEEKKEGHFEACAGLNAILRRTFVMRYTSHPSATTHDFL